uniref:ShKT domain-containing protein n=1 Tax=Caenorhabditis tropicalis TaxID=1561998 RepID=A0A1I7TSM2_9PELO
MNKLKYSQKWITLFSILSSFEVVKSQLENMSNVGNIVLEQDPRDQDPFYRNYYARAEGMPLAAVNSVVHNVKHQSEGQFKIWHELPSHKVRPGYSTTTKAPKIRTTTVPWVRGRHRPQLGPQQVPWQQNDPDGYDTGHGTDYEDDQAQRPRGRRPPGGRGRRPPAPTAPVRVQVGKGDELIENKDGLELEGEGTKVDSEGKMDSEDVKTTTEKTKTASKTTTKKPETKKEEKKEEESLFVLGDEGTRKENPNDGEGMKNGEIDLAELKKGGVVHEKEEEEEEEEDEENGELKKVDGDVRIPKSVDGDTDGHKDDEDYEDEEEDEAEEENERSSKKRHGKKGKHKKETDENEEDDEEDYDEEEEEEEENEDSDHQKAPDHHNKKKSKKRKPSCPPPQRHQNPSLAHHQNIPSNQVSYPRPDIYGYTTTPMTTLYITQTSVSERIGDDYHEFESMDSDQDLKKIRKTSKPPDSGVDCSTAVDEFPLKCGAWKSAGFCDTNQATQFLWCRKTCLCSTTTTISTTTSSRRDN